MERLLDKKQIDYDIFFLAEKVYLDYFRNRKNELPPVFICVLNGGFMFFSDLLKKLEMNLEVDFIRAKSYEGKDNSGGVKILKDIETDLQGKRVYIVDDIVDTGNTMREILFYLEDYRPEAIKIITAFHRKNSKCHVDFYACEVGDEWLVGYGLDDNGLQRNLPHLYAL